MLANGELPPEAATPREEERRPRRAPRGDRPTVPVPVVRVVVAVVPARRTRLRRLKENNHAATLSQEVPQRAERP